jgi:hypothetical protein
MLYLAVQFAWFLLAAFAIGLVFGWLAIRGGLRGFLAGPALGLLIAWAAAAALVWFRLVNDQAAFWIETALLHLLAYLAGCLIGSLLQRGDVGEMVPALPGPASRLALPGPPAALAPPVVVAATTTGGMSAVAPEAAPPAAAETSSAAADDLAKGSEYLAKGSEPGSSPAPKTKGARGGRKKG